MSDTLRSARHKKLVELLVRERKRAEMTQAELASRLGRHQSFVANIGTHLRRIDVVEFLDLVTAIGADPRRIITELTKEAPSHRRRPRARPAE